MARGVRGRSKASRDSQRKLRNRKQRKKWAKEIEGLEGGKNYKLFDPGGGRKKRRIKSLKSKLNIPKKMPETTKPDGSKLEPTTSGSKESQAKAQQKVIDSKEYKEGRKKQIAQQKAKEDGADERQDKMTPEQTKKALELYNKRQKKTPPKKETPKEKKKSEPKKDKPGSNVFTRHYKTGKTLGVMTRAQRRKYDAEAKAAGGKSFGERVDATGDKSNRRETNYIASQRKKKPKKKITLDKIKDDLKVKTKETTVPKPPVTKPPVSKPKEKRKFPKKKKNWKGGR